MPVAGDLGEAARRLGALPGWHRPVSPCEAGRGRGARWAGIHDLPSSRPAERTAPHRGVSAARESPLGTSTSINCQVVPTSRHCCARSTLDVFGDSFLPPLHNPGASDPFK